MFLKKVVSFYQKTRRHIPEDTALQTPNCAGNEQYLHAGVQRRVKMMTQLQYNSH
jgi:hypothetical protein